MAVKSIRQTAREEKANDPSIEPNQIWEAKYERKVIRRLRVLAQMPEPTGYREKGRAWIMQELGGGTMNTEIGRIFVCPEFNLRYIFRLSRKRYGS